MTKSQIQALEILKETSLFNPIGAKQFARKMWPDNPMHTKNTNCGANGSRKGAGAWLSAGSYLAKLRSRGWVGRTGEYLNQYYITPEGKKELEGINHE